MHKHIHMTLRLQWVLNQRPKSKEAMLLFAASCFSNKGCRAVTQVVTSKLIDVFGFYLNLDLKIRVSYWLADKTKTKSSDFFYKKFTKAF
jgi:hypothetical protein